MQIEKEIELINEIVGQAAIYGGDAGGPYCSNIDNLTRALKNWLLVKGIEDQYKVEIKRYRDVPEMPLIVKINGENVENTVKTIVF